ncbi:hypothetical protein K6V92_10195 [Cupriavidus respiraculi]|uniref:hypothetical protein n=1 Tax=Cupriavidus respiraculi TaxID=195930 RepID=UPI001C959B33|nr:hypothetical protein [Cupriavidus respiraculi]MBY4946988.1 hypothetical protein [Cupriavidus respiraculi]
MRATTRTDRVALWLTLTCAAAVLATWAYIAIGHARYFDGYFANGAFQLLNPMRRLMDGQVPGRDFFVFHGVGTVWLHLSIYWAFGQSFPAAEASRFLTSGLLHCIACFWLWRILRRQTDESTAAVLSLLFLVTTALALDRIFLPQNTLLGTRSVFPLYVALAMASTRGVPVVALLAGAALLVSTEHGMAAAIGLAVAAMVGLASKEWRGTGIRLAASLPAAVAVFALVLWAMSGDAAIANIRYALRDVPNDQFWYFGARAGTYLPTYWQTLNYWGFYAFAGLWLLAGALTIKLWRARSPYSLAAVFLTTYATFGAVSQLGYLDASNLQGGERALLLVAILSAAQFRTGLAATVALVLVAAACWGYGNRLPLAYAWPTASQDGELLSPYWRDHLAAVERLSKGGPIWSIYAGLPEAQRGTFAPSSDYIIHALGPANRRQYVAAFDDAKPTLVRLENAFTWGYSQWTVSSNWEFYRRVFAQYELAHEDKMSSLWVRTGPASAPADATEADIEGNCFTAAGKEGRTILSMQIRYRIDNPLARVPVIGLTPRLTLVSGRPNDEGVSLPPSQVYGGAWSAPLVLGPNERATFCLKLDTYLPGVTATLERVTLNRPPLTPSAADYMGAIWKR